MIGDDARRSRVYWQHRAASLAGAAARARAADVAAAKARERRALGWSAAAIACELGVHENSVYRYLARAAA